jgi:pullulanase-type alpha-1,6-glucosidase
MRRPTGWARATLLAPLLLAAFAARAQSSVGIPGSYQSEVGCPNDWAPECALTQLEAVGGDVWRRELAIPAGSFEYKVALNGTWDVNYGAGAVQNGPNIPLVLPAAQPVRFYYSNSTHWVTSNVNSTIATAVGSFQSELGCAGDWAPDCLRSWLQDPDGDGIYTFTATLPAGAYEAKVALDERWDVNYGAGGIPGGSNIPFAVPVDGTEVLFQWDSVSHLLQIVVGGVHGDLGQARAHWLAPDLLAWPTTASLDGAVATLHADPDAGLALSQAGVTGGETIALAYDPAGLPADVVARYPHLAGARAFRLSAADAARAGALVQDQLAVSLVRNGAVADATALQLPGVLDALYGDALAAARTPLGPSVQGRTPTLRVWAPTARTVALHLFDAPRGGAETVVPMSREPSGAWSVTGGPGWIGKYYLFEVQVYAPTVRQVVTNLVTDPYSVSLSMNSGRSQLVSLEDPRLEPPGWRELEKPRLGGFEDIVLYELHVRDFSQNDPTVPAPLKGSFAAFGAERTLGARHLERLARAGVTHVHLLPAFDFATVNEDRATWQAPAGDLASFPPDSTEQRTRTEAVRSTDGFNWGYDPLHYTVPEGSYSLSPDGAARVVEFRVMVQALARRGLRTVMDVVYNHTNAAGQAPTSVLDRIVPGYYHRLDEAGNVETSTCCANTASEHSMMRRLMVDSVVTWARAYKVDGFRFDLMGHHMKADLLAVRAALDALTPARDGVDGRKIYLYGEGWNFGEVADDARGVNATQVNMAGTRIGTFTDRLRDAVRGGGPFSPRRDQGFATGLYWDPNGTSGLTLADEKARLDHYADLVRLGMAANLAALPLVRADGVATTGAGVDYNGAPAGYAREPADVINYISAHDNDDWFDALNQKEAAAVGMDDRERMHALGLTVVALSQGVPFFHAGDEIMRSKSGDGNSYDSGDWWNKLDWSMTWNGWGSGLPPGGPDDVLQPLLADPALRPAPVHLARSLHAFEEALAIRRSNRLFRLRTGAEVIAATTFFNQGPAQVPGLVVERIAPSGHGCDTDAAVIVVNATGAAQTFADAAFRGQRYALHPVQRSSMDPVVRTARFDGRTGAFTVPARTVAVFVTR